jgi:serine O-acetyltransferase
MYHFGVNGSGPKAIPIDPHDLVGAAKRLTESILADERTHHISTAFLPHRHLVIRIVDQLTWLMFPGFIGPRELSADALGDHVRSVISEVSGSLFEQVSGALRYERKIESRGSMFREQCAECDARAAQVVSAFMAALPNVRRLLSLDVQAAYDGDPAARHTDETIFCYPGIRASTSSTFP